MFDVPQQSNDFAPFEILLSMCPMCGSEDPSFLGLCEEQHWYRCRDCGFEYSLFAQQDLAEPIDSDFQPGRLPGDD